MFYVSQVGNHVNVIDLFIFVLQNVYISFYLSNSLTLSHAIPKEIL